MNETSSAIIFDSNKLQVSDKGVHDFVWPVSYRKRQDFCDQIAQSYVKNIEKYNDGSIDFVPYLFFAKYFITEGLAVFNTDALKSCLPENDFMPPQGRQYRLWSALFVDEMPAPPPFIEKFKKLAKKKQRLDKRIIGKVKKILSFVRINKDGLSVGYLKLKPITKSALENDIIATQRSELIQIHALQQEKDVIFCRSDRWFESVNEEAIKQALTKKNKKFEDAILNDFEKLYKENDLVFGALSRQYLSDVLSISTAILRVHYERLMKNPQALPHHVWTGSGGNTWDAMLRHASLKTHDGISAGHDHGAGQGHVDNPMMGLLELWGCKEFICINQNQADEMTKRMSGWYDLEGKMPVLKGLDHKSEHASFSRFEGNITKTKKVLVQVAMTGGDRVWAGPFSPDIVLIDFYARLTSDLKKMGYDVVLKLHPDLPPLPEYFYNIDAEISTEPFEDAMKKCDLVVLDCLYTTIFRSVLSTNIPLVLIDFYDHPWTEKALKLFKMRSGFVETGFDNQNRRTYEKQNLSDVIHEALFKNNNTEFFDYYYK